MGVSAQLHRSRAERLGSAVLVLLFGVLLPGLLLLAPAAGWALDPQRWTLQDQSGLPWSLTLLEQLDPSYPGGLRLRLTDRSGRQHLDHRLPLQLRDGLGGSWELENRSAELVPAGNASLPDGSAQFDLPRLEPQPRAELPLLLLVPLTSDDPAELMASPAAVAALHAATAP
jgi:hypothetical protein